jgi:flagella basal body P-ring formation protein FlgA
MIALALALAALPAFQDLNSLDRVVAIALGADIGQPGGAVAPIDRRLKLAACPVAPTVEPGIAGSVSVRCAPLGWRVRVVTGGGSVASASPGLSRLHAAPVIRRGDPVQMTVETDEFAISVEAIADQDGAPGDRIRVRTDDKGGPRMAQVVDAGRVTIAGYR